MLRNTQRKILFLLAITLAVFSLSVTTAPQVHADNAARSTAVPQLLVKEDTLFKLVASGSSCTYSSCTDPAISCTSNNCNLEDEYVIPIINLLSASFGVIAVISLILGGINYTTSEGDPQKISRAKVRIRNTIIAVVAYMFLYAFLNFLIPGGIFQ
jgi:hypothetical protein